MPMTHDFHPTMLREYDIRGIVGDTMTEADAHAIGRSFATLIRRAGGRRVAAGYDGRLSSPMLEAAMVAGLKDRKSTRLNSRHSCASSMSSSACKQKLPTQPS